jgi:hypothetical protein
LQRVETEDKKSRTNSGAYYAPNKDAVCKEALEAGPRHRKTCRKGRYYIRKKLIAKMNKPQQANRLRNFLNIAIQKNMRANIQ